MKTRKKIDMTQGSVYKLALAFAIPLCIGSLLQQMYNTVDTLIIGNFCSSASLAAVATSAQPVELLLFLFIGTSTGFTILISQSVGSGNTKKLEKISKTATSFLYLVSVPLTVIGIIIGPLILKLMQVPEDAFSYSVTYLRIVFLATLGNLGYNTNAGILRGVGDSRSSLLFLMVSCIANIVLDLLFVAGLNMGVAGAAWATAIAMYCSWICSIFYIKKNYPELNFTILPKGIDKSVLHDIIKIGLPLGLNQSLYSIGHLMMQSLVNSQGSSFMAACAIGSKLAGIANIAISSLSNAATTYSGQNYGAGNYVRLKHGGLRIPLFSAAITCTFGVTMCIFCKPLLRLFTDDIQVLEMAITYCHILLPLTWTYAVFNGIICYANGMKIVRYPTIVNLTLLFGVRLPSAYLIDHFIGGQYIMAAIPISFIFAMICMLAFFFTKPWKEVCRRAAAQTDRQTA